MTSKPTVHIVHCIDTEGPLDEDINATFKRLGDMFDVWLPPSEATLQKLQHGELPLDGKEEKIAKVFSKDLLRYNKNWDMIREMLKESLSDEFRNGTLDSHGKGWVYSWHCMDHMGFQENPRHKDQGYGNVFDYYKQILEETASHHDEINWHFHPLSVTRNPLSAATSYHNSMDVLLHILARRILEHEWFPTTNRPGFHAERPDSHAFLEQWIPFDYANQALAEESTGQRDAMMGRFGDWSRAPQSWQGYHPDHDDYQTLGQCRRWIFRCLNIGTRFRLIKEHHIREAFDEAQQHGSSILCFANHDYRDIRPDVKTFQHMLKKVAADYPNVNFKFNGAERAAREHIFAQKTIDTPENLSLALSREENRIFVECVGGETFGSQPFLAFSDHSGNVYHDNFDVLEPRKKWTYVFDDQTLALPAIQKIGVGSAGRYGGYDVQSISL